MESTCHACGEPLPPADADGAVTCARCGMGHRVEGGKLVPVVKRWPWTVSHLITVMWLPMLAVLIVSVGVFALVTGGRRDTLPVAPAPVVAPAP